MLALSDHFALSGDDGADLRRLGDFSVDGTVFRFNDGKPDPWGNFWAGTCTLADKGPPCALYRLGPDGSVTELFGGIGLSNGLDWTDDRRAFYFADSYGGGVDVFATDPDTGALSGRQQFIPVSGGLPDGLTLDAEGGLWLAVWGSGELRRYTPDGRLDTVVKLPVTQVTSAAFGGADLGTLYITTARENFTPAEAGRAAPRRRHLRLHPRRDRAPAILVRCLTSPRSWTATAPRVTPRRPTCSGCGRCSRPPATLTGAISRCTSPRPR